MSERITYSKMKHMYTSFIDQMFTDEVKNIHGWEKQDFLDALHADIHAEYEEETYDIALEAPSTLQ